MDRRSGGGASGWLEGGDPAGVGSAMPAGIGEVSLAVVVDVVAPPGCVVFESFGVRSRSWFA